MDVFSVNGRFICRETGYNDALEILEINPVITTPIIATMTREKKKLDARSLNDHHDEYKKHFFPFHKTKALSSSL